jgi:ABC-type taurine transport system substrate-binding protein
MELKVRLLDGSEEKGVAQIEQELLEKHEQQIDAPVIDTDVIDTPAIDAPIIDKEELTEEEVLSYIGKRYNKQINSLDELASQREESDALPEDVAAYMKYKKETGRGFEDFLNLKKDYDSMDSDTLLRNYLLATQDGLDADDIETLMDDYRYEEYDDDSIIRKVKLETKKAVAEAKKFFNSQKEKYRVPLESSAPLVSDEEKEIYEGYKQYTKQAKTIEEENERKRNWFNQKTDELFNGEFKGFEFNVNDATFCIRIIF